MAMGIGGSGQMKKRVILSWSSGKDCAWSLYLLRQNPEIEVVGLLTTFNTEANRVAMHAVRRVLVESQAAAAGLPLWSVELPWPCSNEQYEGLMRPVVQRAVSERVDAMAFGDLFLEDVRDYRIKQLQGTGLEPMFPAWGLPTDRLSRDMIDGGLEAWVTCIDPAKLPATMAGNRYAREFLNGLPNGVDPCGENGEFHTFAAKGPMFDRSIAVVPGVVVERDGFVFADLEPAS